MIDTGIRGMRLDVSKLSKSYERLDKETEKALERLIKALSEKIMKDRLEAK